MLTESTIQHLPSTDHILCKRGTSGILLGYYDLPVQPANIILIQGLLWRRKSRIFLIDALPDLLSVHDEMSFYPIAKRAQEGPIPSAR
ncbi:unnamed protein product [Penicillium roqueforti FM164]|uniref:Str. FM013 n=2 Tax=Penicillium TaxID=5073 RepID=A0A0G4PYJ8_PENC3|nr:unnamed protein product [Penicillium roqueforti FM164]CRL31409.1 unnamed protein product [Penicillium camemberti]